MMRLSDKRGYYFTIDALIAVIIIIGVVLILKPNVTQTKYESSVQEDLLQTLSTVKIGEINNSYVNNTLIPNGKVKNPNQSVLEQIGEMYASSDSDYKILAQNIIDELDLKENVALYFGNELIANSSKVPYDNATTISTARLLISGIQNGTSATGFSSRAYLYTENKVDYFYFGGYVGDGNITAKVSGDIIGAKIEGDFSGNFTLYINGNNWGIRTPTPGTPYEISFTQAMLNDFVIGDNYVEFKSSNGNLYIAGGYLRVIYNLSAIPSNKEIRNLPGIEGLINLYDSFYVPGNLNKLNISLHYNSSQDIFLNIGNVTVFEGNSSGVEETIVLDNVSLASNLSDFAGMNKKTIPFRLGLRNASYVVNMTLNSDVFSVSDLSGSMCKCAGVGSWSQCYYSQPLCESTCSSTCTAGIYETKTANYALINGILNTTGNLVGLVGYEASVPSNFFHELSIDNASLRNVIDNIWEAEGSTCICCGINKALQNFRELMAYYSLNGNVADNANINNITIHGNPQYLVGQEGQAMEFDGVDDYLSAETFVLNNQGTIAFWFKLNETFNSSSTVSQGLWSKYRDNSNNAHIALVANAPDYNWKFGDTSIGDIQVKMESGGGSEYVESLTNSWNANQWYHIAVTWDGSRLRLYVNGVLEDSEPSNRNVGYTGDHNFGRGRFDTTNWGTPRYLNGSMDDIRAYGRALSQSEIQDLMQTPPNCGNGIVETGEVCDDGNSDETDICSNGCTYNLRHKAMVVMSDGVANAGCSEQPFSDARDDAEQAACDAYEKYGIVVHSVAFGTGVDTTTLQDIRNCGHGNFYSGDISDIIDIYNQIASDVITASYTEQTVIATGIYTKLFPDSYIGYSYSRPPVDGMVISAETPIFGASAPVGLVTIPDNSTPYEVGVISYSGAKWTSRVQVNNSVLGGWDTVYDLGNYNSTFLNLGDPYIVRIPIEKIIVGNNTINVSVGLGTNNYSAGSDENKIIYSVIKNLSSYSPVVPSAEGCNWTIEFEDSTVGMLEIPANYSGSDKCFYNSSISSVNDYAYFNKGDAIEYSIFLLLRDLDLNKNGRIETKFDENDLSVTSTEIAGIPFTWDTEVQVRVWI